MAIGNFDSCKGVSVLGLGIARARPTEPAGNGRSPLTIFLSAFIFRGLVASLPAISGSSELGGTVELPYNFGWLHWRSFPLGLDFNRTLSHPLLRSTVFLGWSNRRQQGVQGRGFLLICRRVFREPSRIPDGAPLLPGNRTPGDEQHRGVSATDRSRTYLCRSQFLLRRLLSHRSVELQDARAQVRNHAG